jgi:ABC-type amino acid transport substrate-binding protein
MKIYKIILFISILYSSIYAKSEQKKYTFGYINNSMSNYSAKDLKLTMDIWMKEVTKNLGDVKMIFYDNPRDAAKDLNNGKLDYISGFPIVFIKYFNISKLSDGFTGDINDTKLTNFVVLSKRDNKINSIKDLKNVRVGIQNNDEIMYIYTKVNIQNPKIQKYKTRTRVVLDLFFNKLDIAIVPLKTFELTKELNPQINKSIKILKYTKYSSNILGFFKKEFKSEDKEFIFNTGINIFKTARGKQMMDIYKIERLVHTKVKELKKVELLYKKYKKIYKGE